MLEIYEKGLKCLEVDYSSFRELHDILLWMGAFINFHQYDGKESEISYEFYIRDKDYRAFKYNAQRQSGTIEIQLRGNLLAVITL